MGSDSSYTSTSPVQNSAAVLKEVWGVWAEVCSRLTPQEWARKTRCGDWDVTALAAHVSSGVSGLRALLDDRRVDGPAEMVTASAVIRAVKPSSDIAARLAERVAAQALDDAAATPPPELIERFEAGREVCERASGQLGQSCDYFGRGTATIGAAVDLRIVEASVHLLDLQDAVGLTAAVPADAMRITIAFLTDLVPPVTFVEVATGRRTADIFPVHS